MNSNTFRTGFKPVIEHVNVLIQEQGVGDIICNIPALLYLYKKYPHVIPHIWLPDFLVPLYKNLLPKGAIVHGYSEGEKKYRKGWTTVSTGSSNNNSLSSNRMHPVDYASVVLLSELLDVQDKNYGKLSPIDVSHFNLPSQYVVISVGATAPVKAMPPHIINELAQYVLKKGYTPVFVGSDKEQVSQASKLNVTLNVDVDYSVGINLCNKTTIVEVASILAGAKCLVGMEGGLVHVAALSDIPVVASYTYADPKTLMPYRNDTLGFNIFPVSPKSECKFCLTKGNFTREPSNIKKWARFDACIFKDFACVNSLNSAMFIEKLESIL